jgi:hypothetical protein
MIVDRPTLLSAQPAVDHRQQAEQAQSVCSANQNVAQD